MHGGKRGMKVASRSLSMIGNVCAAGGVHEPAELDGELGRQFIDRYELRCCLKCGCFYLTAREITVDTVTET